MNSPKRWLRSQRLKLEAMPLANVPDGIDISKLLDGFCGHFEAFRGVFAVSRGGFDRRFELSKGSLRWNILYPNYINSKKTVQEGRRIGLEKAVEHPRAGEMAEVCE